MWVLEIKLHSSGNKHLYLLSYSHDALFLKMGGSHVAQAGLKVDM